MFVLFILFLFVKIKDLLFASDQKNACDSVELKSSRIKSEVWPSQFREKAILWPTLRIHQIDT